MKMSNSYSLIWQENLYTIRLFDLAISKCTVHLVKCLHLSFFLFTGVKQMFIACLII